jgi:hypothetical protein
MERLVIVAEEQHVQWGNFLLLRVTQIAGQVNAQNIASLIGERVLLYAEKKDENLESEIVLWARADEHFSAAWTSVSPRSEIVEIAQCQSDLGLVAEIFATESARSMGEPLLQASSFTNLGERRGKPVTAMRGLPILAFGRCIGVLTWVGYGEQPVVPFDESNKISELAMIFGRVSELKILKTCLGMEVDL